MGLRNLALIALVAIPLALNVGCSGSDSTAGGAGSGGTGGDAGAGGGGGGEVPPDPYASNVCVGAKQAAASTFCKTLFDAWEVWSASQTSQASNKVLQKVLAAACFAPTQMLPA